MADGLRNQAGDYINNAESKDVNIFEWNIANFREAFETSSSEKRISSPVFVGKSTNQPYSFWYIQTFPHNTIGKDLAVNLVMNKTLNQPNRVIKAKFEVGLLNGNQQKLRCRRNGCCHFVSEFLNDDHGWGFSAMATHSELLDWKNGFLDDNVLRIQVKLWIQNDKENATTPERQYPEELHEHFSQLLRTPQFSDVTIEVEDCSLKAYKGILACRSPVFAALFQNEMAESLTSTIKIEDFSSRTVKGMLQFIYSGNLDNVDEDFMELLKIAEKYELRELKLACTKAAVLKMSAENVFDILIIGDMYNVPELKSKAMVFINSNKANPLFSQGNNHDGAFEKFVKEHPMLVVEMFQGVRNNDVRVHHSGESDETLEEMTRFTTNVKR